MKLEKLFKFNVIPNNNTNINELIYEVKGILVVDRRVNYPHYQSYSPHVFLLCLLFMEMQFS